MSSILMDNWSLESAISIVDENIYSKDNYEHQSWINFLTAIILWDEIWYYDNYFSGYWQDVLMYHSNERNILVDILFPIKKDIFDMGSEKTAYVNGIPYKPYKPDFSGGIAKSTNEYRLLGSIMGINVILHPNRNTLEVSNQNNNYFDRQGIFEYIDKRLLEYYQYINNKLGRNYLSFKFPVLYDYIRKSTTQSNPRNELITAIQIRNDNHVKRFRDEINHLEHIINEGDTQALLTQLNLIDELTENLSSAYKKEIYIGEINIGIGLSLVKTIPLKIKCNENMKIHTTFIRKLVDFGINKRSIK